MMIILSISLLNTYFTYLWQCIYIVSLLKLLLCCNFNGTILRHVIWMLNCSVCYDFYVMIMNNVPFWFCDFLQLLLTNSFCTLIDQDIPVIFVLFLNFVLFTLLFVGPLIIADSCILRSTFHLFKYPWNWSYSCLIKAFDVVLPLNDFVKCS